MRVPKPPKPKRELKPFGGLTRKKANCVIGNSPLPRRRLARQGYRSPGGGADQALGFSSIPPCAFSGYIRADRGDHATHRRANYSPVPPA